MVCGGSVATSGMIPSRCYGCTPFGRRMILAGRPTVSRLGGQTTLISVADFGSIPAPGVLRRIRREIQGAANDAAHWMLVRKLTRGGGDASNSADAVAS